MPQTIPSLRESSESTTVFNSVLSDANSTPDAPEYVCEIYSFDDYIPAQDIPSGFLSVSEVVRKRTYTPEGRAALAAARKELGEELYRDSPSLRSVRLSRGLSQSDLAEKIETKQSYIARIENGTADMMLTTARRLCVALSIDMNVLAELMEDRKAQHGRKAAGTGTGTEANA